ncbi:hypothetical protein [Natronococcus occultus]|uniref:Uncharacterized protein n=1 Tax=Natronococcus occultus SP4 TaxID=694430 RepID=L0JXI6_9EURY|nr:hypothetical protein [Natronococcus occultus]AGB37752.1 hypothetical protein Natoc_1962 [Natronococcus occultus SP4]
MSLVTTGGIAASIAPSILPFDATYGVTVAATAMLALFMLAMVFFAVAPVVSSKWGEEFGSDVAAPAVPEDDADAADDASADDTPEAETVVEGEETASADEATASSSEAATAGAADTADTADAADASDDVSGADVAEGPFTNDELGKLVERADGKVIGTVASVGGDRARVEPNPDALDQILVRLGRAEVGEPFVVEADDVREINDRRVHLEREFVRPTGEPTPETDGEADDVSAATE